MPTLRKRRYPLFDAYGFAVGCSAVHRESLEVLPVVDALLAPGSQEPIDDSRRDLELRPGVAAHTLQFASNKTVRKPAKWARKMVARHGQLLPNLEKHEACLLPGGAHPIYRPSGDAKPGAGMDPAVRAACTTLFDLGGHGWSNDQALRLELRFDKDAEFGKLHAAVRLLMPILPGLAAASPILDGRVTGMLDSRLDAHLHAHERFPDLMGYLVPEAVFDREAHDREILVPIARALAAHDPLAVLDPVVMNARGATVDHERGSLSIHVIDAQESPGANMAVMEFVITVLKAMVAGRWVSNYMQRAWSVEDLQSILLNTIKEGDRTIIANGDYLLMFGLMKQGRMPTLKLWQHLFVEVYGDLSESTRLHIGHILEHGSLATRILTHVGKRPAPERIRSIYARLADCLQKDRLFV